MPLLAPIPKSKRALRGATLIAGLTLYGFSDGLLVLAGLGLDPWDVLQQGLSRSVGLQVGTWTDIVGAVVLLAWIPLRQRPGIGTVCNVIVIGLAVNVTLSVVPTPKGLGLRIAVMAAAVALNGLATGLYIGAGLGPGPRDGVTTALAARGHSLRMVRTVIELSVLVLGAILGGTVGAGTIAYALGIGPITHLTIPAFELNSRRGQRALSIGCAGPAPG